MKRVAWQLSFVVLGLVVLALALPGSATAAPENSSSFSSLHDSLVEGPVQPTFAVSGVFSVKFGEKAGDAEIDLPSINTVATVSGLQIGQGVAWDFLSVKQKQPIRTESFMISEAQATISGAAKGYATEASAQVELYPSRAFQAKGKLALKYDAMNRTSGFTIQNASVNLPTWPVGVVAIGINASPQALSIDSAQVSFPGADTMVMVESYQLKNGQSTWKNLAVAQGKSTVLKLGDAVTISGMQVSTSSPNAGSATTASADFKVNVSNAVKADGRLMGVTSQQLSGVGLVNGNMTLGASGWTLDLAGMNSIKSGVKIDTITIAANPLDLEAILKGVTVGGSDGFAFDQAQVKYTPNQGGGFQMLLTRSPQGYVLATTSVIPIAASK